MSRSLARIASILGLACAWACLWTGPAPLPAGAAEVPPGAGPSRLARPAADLTAYKRIAQWPERAGLSAGVLRDAVALDVAADGRVYIADAGAGGVHVMLPSGTFLAPFGASESGPARLGGVGRLALDQAAGRLYVLDTGDLRVVVYDLDGNYQASWPAIDGAAIAVGPDGRVYVADREKNAIQAFDPGGARLFTFGGAGTARGRFMLLSDVSVSPDGRTIAVGDLNDQRVQLFDLGSGGADLRTVYELNEPRFSAKAKGPPYNQCRAGAVHALGGDTVWVGDGTGACRISPEGLTYTIAASANAGTLCKQTVRVPRIRPGSGQYYAVADYDPNSGPCYSSRRGKDTRLPTTPAVVSYRDPDLRQTVGVFLSGRDSKGDAGLVSPWFVSSPAPGQVLLLDGSRLARLYQPDGSPIATVALDSRQSGGATRRTSVRLADGTGAAGEIFGYYRSERRGRRAGTGDLNPTLEPTVGAGTATPTPAPTGTAAPAPPPETVTTWIEDAHGIGRFRSTTVLDFGRAVQVLEPVWTFDFSVPSLERSADLGSENRTWLQVLDVAYAVPSADVVLLVYERSPGRRKDDARLVFADASGAGRLRNLDLPDDTVTTAAVNPYVDLSVGPDGRIHVLDDYRDVVLTFAADGTPLAEVPVAADVRAIAGGPAPHLFGLREAGYVERYAPDGTVTARFDGRPFPNADPLTLSALAADDQGRVYVADGLSSVVSVFVVAPEGDPALPVPGDATCVVSGHKTAAPADLVLGDTTTVSLALDGTCGIGEDPSDVVIVALYYPDPSTPDPAEFNIKALRRLVSRIDFTRHRVGLVGYFRDASVEAPLGSDPAAVLRAIQKMPRKWPALCRTVEFGDRSTAFCRQIAPVLREGIRAAHGAFDPASSRRKVMVLFQPDYCNRDLEYYDGVCRVYPIAEDAAAEARADGVQIVVYDGDRVGWRAYHLASGDPNNIYGPGTLYNADAQPLANSDADVVLSYPDAQHRMVRYHAPETLATALRLVDGVPGNMRLLAGSLSPPATVAGSDVTWTAASLSYGPSVFSLVLEPLAVGRWPTNLRAVADFVDGWGAPGQVVFNVPEVVVRAPTPTATALPTSTATHTPGPTATVTGPPPRPAYLPVAHRGHCLPGKMAVRIAIVVDCSSSMEGAKLDAARDAIRTFLDFLHLAPGTDTAAIVSFNVAAQVVQSPTGDRGLLEAALSSLATRPGTRIDLGMEAALSVLAAAARAPDELPIVVLLSDGRQDDAALVVAQGQLARQSGVEVFTIGLGADVDAELLRELATDAGHAYLAPSPEELRAIYEAVARTIPCR